MPTVPDDFWTDRLKFRLPADLRYHPNSSGCRLARNPAASNADGAPDHAGHLYRTVRSPERLAGSLGTWPPGTEKSATPGGPSPGPAPKRASGEAGAVS